MIQLLAQPVTERLHTQIRERVKLFEQTHRRAPKLSVILVGEDPASVIYVRKKSETALSLGIQHETFTFSPNASPLEVQTLVHQLNLNPKVDGILIQRPLPQLFDEREVLFWIAPQKDVDSFHPENAGKLFLGIPSLPPCTPAGIMELLHHYQISVAGKTACVIGRSTIVGRPIAALLLQAHATVFSCHSQTKNLKLVSQQAEILIVAAGKRGLIDSSYVRPGAVVIDVGVHRNDQGKLAGDVVFEDVSRVASAITPVPGGVGPMTLAILMRNTVTAAEQNQMGKK